MDPAQEYEMGSGMGQKPWNSLVFTEHSWGFVDIHPINICQYGVLILRHLTFLIVLCALIHPGPCSKSRHLQGELPCGACGES